MGCHKPLRLLTWTLIGLVLVSLDLGAGRLGSGWAITGAVAAETAIRPQLPDFTPIVRRYGPAVVNISVINPVQTSPEPLNPELNRNGAFYFFNQYRRQLPRQAPVRGLGSGFIIRADGLIVTNAHVIAGAQRITVTLTDERQFRAKVLGADRLTDIAVLKIDATDLPRVRIGDPSKVQAGQWVVAIGSPFGFENSVTAGIVSATARPLPRSGYVPFLQTDVPLNPGNSGSPLFNLDGEVIGVNSQIYSRTGGYQGISFAIPIDVAMNAAEQLIAHGRVERGLLGIGVQSVTRHLALAFGLERPGGALVSAVQPDGPADKAGLQPGDVVLQLNGQVISDAPQFLLLVAEARPGEAATLTIWRAHRKQLLRAIVGGGETNQPEVVPATTTSAYRLQLQVRPLSAAERARALVPGGLMVERAGAAAAAAGIRPGDIVLAVNRHPVSSVEELRAVLAQAGKYAALLIDRNNARMFVAVRLA